jgi:hypothetical protein
MSSSNLPLIKERKDLELNALSSRELCILRIYEGGMKESDVGFEVAVQLLEQQRLIRPLPIKVEPLMSFAVNWHAKFHDPFRTDSPVIVYVGRRVDGAPVANSKRIPENLFDWSPYVDNLEAATEKTLYFFIIWDDVL